MQKLFNISYSKILAIVDNRKKYKNNPFSILKLCIFIGITIIVLEGFSLWDYYLSVSMINDIHELSYIFKATSMIEMSTAKLLASELEFVYNNSAYASGERIVSRLYNDIEQIYGLDKAVENLYTTKTCMTQSDCNNMTQLIPWKFMYKIRRSTKDRQMR